MEKNFFGSTPSLQLFMMFILNNGSIFNKKLFAINKAFCLPFDMNETNCFYVLACFMPLHFLHDLERLALHVDA